MSDPEERKKALAAFVAELEALHGEPDPADVERFRRALLAGSMTETYSDPDAISIEDLHAEWPE